MGAILSVGLDRSGGSTAEFGEVFADFLQRVDFGGFRGEKRGWDGRAREGGGWISRRRLAEEAGLNVAQVGRKRRRRRRRRRVFIIFSSSFPTAGR